MSQILSEFLFKLDVIAPIFVLFYILMLRVKRKWIGSFSNSMLLAFILLEFVLNALSGYVQFMTFNNLWVYHLNCQVTHAIFTWYFVQSIRKKRIVYLLFILFIVVDVVLILSIQPYKVFPSYTYALSSFILIVYSLILLDAIMDKIPTFHILSLKEFWVVTGVLTYFGSAFLIFISYHYLTEVAPKKMYILWQVHNVFIALSCIIFTKAITSKQWMHE